MAVTAVTRTKSKAVRIYEDQWALAEAYAQQQAPPPKTEDVIRWLLDLGLQAAGITKERTESKG